MLIEEKFFDQDKNYLLKAVQAFSKESLLSEWVKYLFEAYNRQHNPMGLQDDFILELDRQISNCKELLNENYDILAAIYRYNHSDNQLEFQWDGRSHMERYDEDWKKMLEHWFPRLSEVKEIQRPLVKYATQGEGINNSILISTIRRSILAFFGLHLRNNRLYKLSA